ncbi:MAG: hypothetical protein GPOALKHO_001571 [Sodalis sp.]|nr:MAG: hypothetical protein GPOALKHO_001571 [Sodalis sp.]
MFTIGFVTAFVGPAIKLLPTNHQAHLIAPLPSIALCRRRWYIVT